MHFLFDNLLENESLFRLNQFYRNAASDERIDIAAVKQFFLDL